MLQKIKYPLAAYLAGAAMLIAVFLPEIIDMRGAIILSGDYNMQSIPFVYHIWDAVHTGSLNWDWSTGLGSQFLSSYAYYNLFSPFTLLYFLFPRSMLLTAMTIVMAVKYGTGTMLAYFYIRRFVKNPNYAVVGGLVYMFLSFVGYNLIFHFADVFALFPLLLIALEELCIKGRKGVFALAVLLMALTNYYFFFGQAIFCVIYYFARCSAKEVGWSWKRLFSVAGEAVIGVCMAMAVMLPVLLALLDSPKATDVMASENMLAYNSVFYYLKMIQSAFMLPDPFMYVSLFPAISDTYPFGMAGASVAAYLPLFSSAGVISYVFAKKHRAWENILLGICVVMAFVPVLNQSFSAFNSGYYARWYYMPLIICALVSVKALEEEVSFKPGIIICGAMLAFLLVYNFFFRSVDTIVDHSMKSNAYFSMPENLLHFGVTLVCFISLIVIICQKRDKDFLPKVYILSAISVYATFGTMAYYLLSSVPDHSYIVDMYSTEESLPEAVDTSERISSSNMDSKNYSQIWGLDSTLYFNSVLDPGHQEFVRSTELVSNGISVSLYSTFTELTDLCSVRYHFISSSWVPPHSKLIGNYGIWSIYENEYYLPMGFVYDEVLSSENYSKAQKAVDARSDDNEKRLYLKYLVVDDPSQFADILPESNDISPISDDEYKALIEKRRAVTCTNLERTTRGLTADIDLDKENIVFFSVSNNSGWRAYVDDEECEALWVNNGLVGVRTGVGQHSIRLEYTVPGLKCGCVISLAGAAAYGAYMAVGIIAKRRREKHDKRN